MAATVLYCKSDSVNYGMVYRAGDLHLSHQPPGDDAQWLPPLLRHLITQQVAHARLGGNRHPKKGRGTGVSPPAQHN